MPPANKPTPCRMVLYTHKDPNAKPWPAVVVDVFEHKDRITVDLQLLPTRGHGLPQFRQDVQFVDVPGLPDSCAFPPRAE